MKTIYKTPTSTIVLLILNINLCYAENQQNYKNEQNNNNYYDEANGFNEYQLGLFQGGFLDNNYYAQDENQPKPQQDYSNIEQENSNQYQDINQGE